MDKEEEEEKAINETTKSHAKIGHNLQMSKGWTPKRWRKMMSKEINAQERTPALRDGQQKEYP